MKNVWKGLAQERWLLFLLDRAGIDPQLTGAELPADKVRALAAEMTAFTMTVSGTQPIEKRLLQAAAYRSRKSNRKRCIRRKTRLVLLWRNPRHPRLHRRL
nr:hypothetical protein [Planococcus sp. MB-3u-03]